VFGPLRCFSVFIPTQYNALDCFQHNNQDLVDYLLTI
jgi:hypothetical protein